MVEFKFGEEIEFDKGVGGKQVKQLFIKIDRIMCWC